MGDDRTQEIRLAAGASQRVQLLRGGAILVRRGRVLLRPPMEWLAESIVAAEVQLGDEDIYVAVGAGGVELMAIGSAEVAVIPDLTPRYGPRRRWWSFLRRFSSGTAR